MGNNLTLLLHVIEPKEAVWLDLLSKHACLLSALFYISVHAMNGNLLVVVHVLINS